MSRKFLALVIRSGRAQSHPPDVIKGNVFPNALYRLLTKIIIIEI